MGVSEETTANPSALLSGIALSSKSTRFNPPKQRCPAGADVPSGGSHGFRRKLSRKQGAGYCMWKEWFESKELSSAGWIPELYHMMYAWQGVVFREEERSRK